MSSNTFNSLKPNFKEEYSDKRKLRFKRVKNAIKAKSELEASKNPMKSLKDKSYLNLKNKKGIAV